MYYWKKNEAQNLYAQAGVQFPGVTMQGVLIFSIFIAGFSVNTFWEADNRACRATIHIEQ